MAFRGSRSRASTAVVIQVPVTDARPAAERPPKGAADVEAAQQRRFHRRVVPQPEGEEALGGERVQERPLVGRAPEGEHAVVDREAGGAAGQAVVVQALCHLVGLDPADPDWVLDIPRELVNEGSQTFERLDLDRRRTIVLAPTTARGASKRWPAGRFAELANVLRRSHFEPLLVVGPGEEPVAAKVREAAGFNLPAAGSDLDVAGLAACLDGGDKGRGGIGEPSHRTAHRRHPSPQAVGPAGVAPHDGASLRKSSRWSSTCPSVSSCTSCGVQPYSRARR